MSIETINPKNELIKDIHELGGWVNAHTHIDRSHIITPDNWGKTGHKLQDKWNYTDTFKTEASVTQIAGHMSHVVEDQLKQGVRALGSFIDCDSVVRDKNLKAAEIVREKYKDDIVLKFMHQPIKGLVNEVEVEWFNVASEFVDIIGGLPERDGLHYLSEDKSDRHLDTIFSKAQELNKPLHIHTDQLNQPEQRDTERVLSRVREFGMLGRVSLIHCISLAAQEKNYRHEMYKLMEELDVSVIACPTAWIDTRRSEVLMPFHNAVTPVDEIVEYGINVALGTDNIADIYKPFSDGDMWTELRVLLESTHLFDCEVLAKIASVNGLKALDI